jgi:hypothetical protein
VNWIAWESLEELPSTMIVRFVTATMKPKMSAESVLGMATLVAVVVTRLQMSVVAVKER